MRSDEDLSLRAQAGDREAERQIFDRHRDLVSKICRSFRVRGVPYEDIEAEGLEALVDAIRNWSPGRGANFLTYTRRLVGKRLIDLYRRSKRKCEVPWDKRLELDSSLGGDEGEPMTVGDSVPDERDAYAEADASREARAVLERVLAPGRRRVRRAVVSPSLGRVERPLRQLLHDLAPRLVGGDEADSLRRTLDGQPQLDLFAPDPEEIAERAVRGFDRLRAEVLEELYDEESLPVVARRVRISLAQVRLLVGMTREGASESAS